MLKKSGSFWLNMGDCYGGIAHNDWTSSNPEIQKKFQKNVLMQDDIEKGTSKGREKCMLMQPERLAIKMIDDQKWILRNKIKWAKQVLIKKENRTIGSVMPTSVKDRFNESGEELYFFVKSNDPTLWHNTKTKIWLPIKTKINQYGIKEKDWCWIINPEGKKIKKSYWEKRDYYSNLDAVRLPPNRDYWNENWYKEILKNNPTSGNYVYKKLAKENIEIDKNCPRSKFNYRVRDAEKKKDQCPQFKASEEEIKRYNEVPEDYGKKKLQSLEDKGKTLNRWMSGTPNYTYQGKFTDNQNAEMFNSPRARTQRNKVNDPRGNHEGGPGSWRDFKEQNPNDGNEFNPAGKNLPTVWQINPQPHNFQKELDGINCDHFASYPEALCDIPIRFGCPPGGIVLDPFCGSGTTCVVAKKLKRNYIGIELSKEYIKIAEERLKGITTPLF